MLDASPEVDRIRRAGRQAADGRPASGSRPAGAGPDAADAVAGRLRDAGARAAEADGQADAGAAEARRPPAEAAGRPTSERPTGSGSSASARSMVNLWPKRLPPLRAVMHAAGTGRSPPTSPSSPVPRATLAEAAAVPRHQSAVRRVPGQPVGHRRPQRADPGDGERAGDCRARWPFRPRAAAGRAAARPAGHHAARRRSCCSLGLATPEELAPPKPRRKNKTAIGAMMFPDERVRVLTLADKLRRLFDYDFPGVHDLRTHAGLGGGRVAGIRRRLQQVRHQQEPCRSRRASSSATCCG